MEKISPQSGVFDYVVAVDHALVENLVLACAVVVSVVVDVASVDAAVAVAVVAVSESVFCPVNEEGREAMEPTPVLISEQWISSSLP